MTAKIQESKKVILGSISSNPETPPPAAGPIIPPDTDLEKLRKEKDAEYKKDRQKKYDKKSYSKKKGVHPTPTKEGILALLRLPFQVGGAITGFNQEPIHPAIEEPLAESALVVLQDFGFEAFQKWLNLGVFAALYGTCGLGWFKGMQEWAKEQQRAALEAKQDKIHDITPPKSAGAAKAV